MQGDEEAGDKKVVDENIRRVKKAFNNFLNAVKNEIFNQLQANDTGKLIQLAKVCSALDEPTVLRDVYVQHVVNVLAPEKVCNGEGFDFKNFEGSDSEQLRKLESHMSRFTEDSIRLLQKEIGSE